MAQAPAIYIQRQDNSTEAAGQRLRRARERLNLKFRDVEQAQIGVARSKDGISGWRRHPANPIIRPGVDKWDHDAVYKPYAIYDGKQKPGTER